MLKYLILTLLKSKGLSRHTLGCPRQDSLRRIVIDLSQIKVLLEDETYIFN